MSKTYYVVDLDRCWGCGSCRAACKMEHGIPVGGTSIDVAKVENFSDEGQLHIDYVPMLCMHCTDAACEKVCAAGALAHDGEGLVVVDEEICSGCGSCVEACPYGAIYLVENAEQKRSVAKKCDLCRDRRRRGFLTSCEQHCIGRTFTSCSEEHLQAITAEKQKWSVGQVVYVSERLKSLGQKFATDSGPKD